MTSIATPPDLHTDFSGKQQQAGKINTDHAAIEAWCGALLTALARVIRPDDTLTDGLVRLRNLHAEVWNQFKVLRVNAHTRATTVWPDGKLVYEKGSGTLWVGDGSTQGGLPASGSGSGGGSAVIWHTITADTTAIAGHGYKIRANANAVTLTLPENPSEDDHIPVIALDTTFEVKVASGGSNVLGEIQDMTLDNAGDGVDLIFTGTILGWSPSGELSVDHRPVALTAENLPFTPASGIEATNTQAAIIEVKDDAAAATASLASAVTAADNALAATIADNAAAAAEDAIVASFIFGGA